MDADIIITLLTITVSLLSLVIIGLLASAIIVLMKVRQLTKNLNIVLANATKATDWLSPLKLIQEARRVLQKSK